MGGWGERLRDWEVEIEKHQLAASYTCPDWGSNPQPRYVPWLGIKPAAFWCLGLCSNHLSPGQGTNACAFRVIGEEGQKGQARKCLFLEAPQHEVVCVKSSWLPPSLACHRPALRAFSVNTSLDSTCPVLVEPLARIHRWSLNSVLSTFHLWLANAFVSISAHLNSGHSSATP